MFSKRIAALRKQRKMTQEELADALGISRAALSHYEQGRREPDFETVQKIASFFGVSTDYLLGRTDDPTPPKIPGSALKGILRSILEKEKEKDLLQKIGATPLGKTVPIPVLGVIRAGEPIFAQENIIEHQEVPEEDVRGGEYFFLIVTGDSMVGAGILPGSRVLVRRQDYVDDGAIAVVLVGEEATIKRVKHVDGKILLIAANPAYEPQVYNEDEVKIIGKVVQTIIKHE